MSSIFGLNILYTYFSLRPSTWGHKDLGPSESFFKFAGQLAGETLPWPERFEINASKRDDPLKCCHMNCRGLSKEVSPVVRRVLHPVTWIGRGEKAPKHLWMISVLRLPSLRNLSNESF